MNCDAYLAHRFRQDSVMENEKKYGMIRGFRVSKSLKAVSMMPIKGSMK